jgi:hypothetical protein
MNSKRPDKHNLSTEQVILSKDELRKIFNLTAQGIYVEMFSEGIDQVWHELIEDKETYEAFSKEACGYIIGHGENKDEGLVSFVEAYERRYGKLPRIWFFDANGVFDENRYAEYLSTGNIISAWVCNPTHNCAAVVK